MNKRGAWLSLFVAVLLLGSLATAVAFASSTPAQTAPITVADLPSTARPAGEIIHVVKWGETLALIARRYGVSVRELAIYNGIANPDRIFVGQKLRIPRARPKPTPAPPSPTLIGPQEEIVIQSPGPGVTVTNPASVSGVAVAVEQRVMVAVLDASAGQIGGASAVVAGEPGQRGPFSVTVPFTVPTNSQPGRIQVFTESPRDGAVEHLSSVTVMLQGLDLDALLGQLQIAIDLKDYPKLQSLMGPKFDYRLYRSEGVGLTPAEAIQQLRQTQLGPGLPRLDFSVDARALLGSRVIFGSEVIHVVYSTGWGSNRDDDAFLMIDNVDGRARWSGLLYVPHALIDYRFVGRAPTG